MFVTQRAKLTVLKLHVVVRNFLGAKASGQQTYSSRSAPKPDVRFPWCGAKIHNVTRNFTPTKDNRIVDEEIKKGASFHSKKKPTATSPEEPKRKDAPRMEL
jgi:hypothetical protein